MIQVWNSDDDTTKYAHFSDGVARFVSLPSDTDADSIRSALLASTYVRTDIEPQNAKSILWHDDDKEAIATFHHDQVDVLGAAALRRVVGADTDRYIVYILKFLELMSIELGLKTADNVAILNGESNGKTREELMGTWAAKSAAWLNVVGIIEHEISTAKQEIDACKNVSDMQGVVEGFPSAVSEALSSD